MDFIRHIAGGPGNLEGHYLKGIQLGTEWVYENPLAQVPLADDEVAIGALMLGMAVYVGGSVPLYPLAEACQDHYLSILCAQALKERRSLRTEWQPWAQ